MEHNTFDQLCINYTNERLQNFFVEIMLSKEKQWYEQQSLKVPFVPFFDNASIIGIKMFSYFNFDKFCEIFFISFIFFSLNIRRL